MIYRIRTITLNSKDVAASRAKFIEAAAYINANYPEVTSEILVNISGSLNQIHWVTKCESLAVLEQYESNRNQDEAWRKIVQGWLADVEPEDMVDNFYAVVSS